jgi:hypothetical protein
VRRRHVGWDVAFDNVGSLSRTDPVFPLGTLLLNIILRQQSKHHDGDANRMRGNIVLWSIVTLARIEAIYDAIELERQAGHREVR